MDGLEISEIKFSLLERTIRIDSEYYRKSYLKDAEILKNISVLPLTKFVQVSDGNHMSISEKFLPEGIPYFRGQDVKSFFIEDSAPICIDEQTFDNAYMLRSHLQSGDVLLSIVGTIGAVSLVSSSQKATCSCKLAILRPNLSDSEIVALYLSCKYGQHQIKRLIRGAVQMGLILEDIDQIVMPVFSDTFKEKMAKYLQHIKILKQSSDENYHSAERILFKSIPVDFSDSTNICVRSYAESFVKTGRLDAEYYQPKYEKYEKTIINSPYRCVRVKDRFNCVTDKCEFDLSEYRYIEIGDINIENGSYSYQVIDTNELPANAKIITMTGDILVSTVRPNRGAVTILEESDLLVSDAFTVLRSYSDYSKEVLQILLRSPMYRDWFLKFNVGTSYPVIKDADVLNMPIPLLCVEKQKAIANKVQESFRLRKEAKSLLDKAIKAVEMAIETDEATALHWLEWQN